MVLAALLPSLDPITVGVAGDAVIVALGFVGGAAVWRLSATSLGHPRALVAGFLPAVLFAALFTSYAYTGSEPRWRAFSLDLARLSRGVVQEIHFREPLQRGQIAWTPWLADLRTPHLPDLLLPALYFARQQSRPQDRHGLILVLELRALVLACGHYAGGEVRYAYGSCHLLNVLAPVAACVEDIDL